HCMLDGISGVDLATVLMDRKPESAPPPKPPSWQPRKAPRGAELLFSSVKEQLSSPLRMAREALEPNSEAAKLVTRLFSGFKPFVEVVSMGRPPDSPLNVAIGPHRRFEMVDIPLAKVKAVRAARGGTVNDVILATVAGALRIWLTARGAAPAADLRVLVPVSMRSRKERGTYGNQVSAVFCPLPLTEASPTERLRKVHEAMMNVKKSGSAVGAHALSRLGDFAPPTLLAQAARLQAVTRFFNLVITNVPGPQFPLYLLGRQLLGCYPQVPLAAQQSIGVALLSYHGNVCVGLLADLDVRDVDALGGAMRAALIELLDCVQAAPETAAGAAVASTGPLRDPRAPTREAAAEPDPAHTPGI